MKLLPAILLWSYFGTAYADEHAIGRLFFTPTERADLERIRNNPSEISTETADSTPLPALNLNGFVRRNDGKSTVWVNKQPMQEGSNVESLNVGKLQPNRDNVTLNLSGNRKITFAPGQRYESGQIITVVPVSRNSKP